MKRLIDPHRLLRRVQGTGFKRPATRLEKLLHWRQVLYNAANYESLFMERAASAQGMTMAKKLYVGNLAFATTSDELRDAFSEFGSVSSATVITDRETGRSRGFGFVEMEDGAEQAIEAMNGKDLGGRTLNVNEARPREDRGGGGRGRY
jgi:cold-inducible RNA-binding protein